MKKSFIVVGLFVGVAWGLAMMKYTHQFADTVSYSSLGTPPTRDPAAIRRTYDFSGLEGMALQTALQNRLIDGAKVVAQNGAGLGLELGHFVVADSGGKKVFACQKYAKVILAFEADGILVAGEKPQMEVESSCEMAENINSISPIWIPYAKIQGEPVADGEFDFKEGKEVRMRFRSVADAWPQKWVLKSVRLQSVGGEQIEVDQKFLRARLDKPLVLNF